MTGAALEATPSPPAPRGRKRKTQATSDAPVAFDPPQALPHIRLPGRDEVVSMAPSAQHAIARVFDRGVEFADQMGDIMGYLATIGFFVFVPAASALALIFFESRNVPWYLILLMLVPTVSSAFMIRLDFSGIRYNPVMCCADTGQVHVMQTLPLKWWQFCFMPWKIAGDQLIYSFDWRCVHAEVVTLSIFQGVVMRTEYQLVLVFTEGPDSNKVVYRSGVGSTTAFDGGAGCINRWEHIRRYMQFKGDPVQGPAFRNGEHLWASAAPSFWRGFFFGQMLLGPGSAKYWKSKQLWVYICGTLSILLLWGTAYYGLVQWLCYIVRPAPKWPQNILQTSGRPLNAKALKGIGALPGVQAVDDEAV